MESPNRSYDQTTYGYYEMDDLGGGGDDTEPPALPPVGGPQTGGICADPRTIGFMDEWLANAIPLKEGNYRFDSWARVIGEDEATRVGNIGLPVDPYTWATRCDYLLSVAKSKDSRNLGTLWDYVMSRLEE